MRGYITMISLSSSFVTNSSNYVLSILITPDMKERVMRLLLHIPSWRKIVEDVNCYLFEVNFPSEIQKAFIDLEKEGKLYDLFYNHIQRIFDILEQNDSTIILECQTEPAWKGVSERDIREYTFALILTHLALNKLPFKEEHL
jgi:hypothetical protein